MDNLVMTKPPDSAPKAVVQSMPTFSQESISALETLDKCRILLEMEYNRSSRSVRDHLINPITQLRNSLQAIRQVTQKS